MRKTILASIAALAMSGSALAVNTDVDGGSIGGAQVSSGAFAASSGNGSAYTETGGYQQSTSGFNGYPWGSSYHREGGAGVAGVAGSRGNAYSRTRTRGDGIAGSGTEGSSFALSGGVATFDTHYHNPEGYAVGGAVSGNVNEASTFSYGYGGAKQWNYSGNLSTYSASAYGNRDGGYNNVPTTDYVETDAAASSKSWGDRGGDRYGNGWRDSEHGAYGVAGAASHAESGNEVSVGVPAN